MYHEVMSKRAAERTIIDSLFTSGGTFACLPKIRLDGGKYAHNLTGRTLPTPSDTPVWCERRKDKHGPYYVLMTFDK